MRVAPYAAGRPRGSPLRHIGCDIGTAGLSAVWRAWSTARVLLRVAPLVLVFVICGALLGYEQIDRTLRAAALLVRWTHAPGVEAIAHHGEHQVATRPLQLALAGRHVDAIEYRPTDEAQPPPVLLIHGAHYRGMRETRLKEFASALASAGLLVITPHLNELTQHHVDASTIGAIEQLARMTARRARYETTSVVGISFAGSLALLAAARESAPHTIGAVTAVGSYASLDRLGHWYAGEPATGPDRDVLKLRPHPYGARVLFQAHAETVFGADADAVRRALHEYLHDRPKRALALAEALPEPPRSDVLTLVGPSDHPLSAKLKSLLRVHRAELAAVSPEHQLRALRVPVLLVHGADDPIIPSTETAWLAEEVPRGALRASLITSAIRHAELREAPTLAELWALVQWAAALLEVTELQSRAPLMR